MPSYVILVLVGSVLQGGGEVLQKYGLTAAHRPDGRTRGRVVWALGVACMIAGMGFGIQGLAQGEVGVVAPLASVNLIVAMGFAVLALKERVARRELPLFACIAAGTLLVLLSAGAPRSGAAGSRLVLYAASCTGGLALLALVLARSLLRRRGEVLLAVGTGLLMGLGNALVKAGAEDLAAAGGRFDVSSAERLLQAIAQPSAQLAAGSFLAGFALLQLALRQGRVSVVSPVRLAVSILVGAVLGAVLFDEALAAGRLVGLALVVAGVGGLARLGPGSKRGAASSPGAAWSLADDPGLKPGAATRTE
jgi:multidrug transporter EmrE-like cation transporter